MDYEIVQQHEYQDIYRLCYGVLVKVNKYESMSYRLSDRTFNKRKHTKVSGIENCYILKEEIEEIFHDRTWDKGNIVFEGYVIKPIKDKSQYFWELKTTGSSFGGDLEKFQKLLKMVQDILDKY